MVGPLYNVLIVQGKKISSSYMMFSVCLHFYVANPSYRLSTASPEINWIITVS
jgi:hypothetical protein